MPKDIVHVYNKTRISQRWKDEYVDLTALCQSEGKHLADYLKLTGTKKYLEALSSDMKIVMSELIQINQGDGGHTFGHPEIAMDVAKWASIPCRIWANRTLINVIKSQKLQRHNQAWIEARESGKLERRVETDTIQVFVDYAHRQGSKNAGKYYVSISTMENRALFFVEQKYPNLREVLGTAQLNTVQTADRIVSKALQDGMDQGLHYKDIYKLAKSRILGYADLVGRSSVPCALAAVGSR